MYHASSEQGSSVPAWKTCRSAANKSVCLPNTPSLRVQRLLPSTPPQSRSDFVSTNPAPFGATHTLRMIDLYDNTSLIILKYRSMRYVLVDLYSIMHFERSISVVCMQTARSLLGRVDRERSDIWLQN